MVMNKNISIRLKVSLLIVLINLVILAVAFSLATFNGYRSSQNDLLNSAKKDSVLIAEYLLVPLMFDDNDEATKLLSGLKNMPNVKGAFLYDDDGSVFATYKNDNTKKYVELLDLAANEHIFYSDHLHIKSEILRAGKSYGVIYMIISTQALKNKLIDNIKLFTLLTIILMIIAYVLANVFQRIITGPILNLSKTMAEISTVQDYKQRIKRVSDDEIGQLYDCFNEMLNRIECSQADLDHLRNYLSNIIDSMPSILIGVDLNGNVTQWNMHVQKYTGNKEEDVLGTSIAEAFPRLADKFDDIIESIRKRQALSDIKQVYIKDDVTHYENVTIYPLVANGIDGAVIRIDDITEQVRLEEMMIQSEKMLSVGGLAAGMAHEINNPLAGMMQNAQVLIRRLEHDSRANLEAAEKAGVTMEGIREFFHLRKFDLQLNMIHESGKRAAKVVQNMLSFARKSDALPKPYPLEHLLDETLELAANDYSLRKKYDFKQIKIIKDYDLNLGHVYCEASKIEQVLLNLFKNGAEAMSESKTEANVKPTFVLRTYREENMAVIEIEDNGPGISEDVRKRIFEPFFTTKRPGKGTGLGLSVSYFIITENHGGEMYVQSNVGEGTKFIIKLPLNRGPNV